jgi:hypothetical protein
MGTVGSVTVGVKADSTQFRAEMVKNQATVKEFAQTAQASGQTASGALGSAAGGSVILSQGLTASTQAAGTLATAMGMIGTAIRVAFPLVGAIALLEVLEKLANNKFAQIGVDIGAGFRTMNLAAETSIDTLKLSTAKMQEQIDLLGGKRPNTLAEDLANAALAADKLATSLDADNRKIKALLQEESLGALSGIITNRAGTADVAGSVNSFDQQLAHLAAVYQHAVRTGSADASKDLKALDDKRLAAAQYQSSQLEQRQRLQDQHVGPNQDANIAVLTGFGDVLSNQSDLEADEKQEKATASKLKGMEDDKKYKAEQDAAQRKAADAAKKAQELLLKQDEEAEKKQNAFNKLTINEEIQFWTDRIAAFTRGGDQYIAVQDKIYDLIAKRPSLFAENKKNQASVGKSQVEGSDILSGAQKALITGPAIEQQERLAEAAKKYNETVAQGEEIQRRSTAAFAETSIAIALAQGSISQLAGAQALSAVHEHDHAEALELVNKQLQEQIRLIGEIPEEKMSKPEKDSAIARAQNEAGNQKLAINGVYASVQAQDQANVSGKTISGAVTDALARMVQSFTDMATNLKTVIPQTIAGLNNDIARLATGQGQKGDFGRTLKGAGEGLVKTGLQSAEGQLLGMLGLGKKAAPGSSALNPSYTVIVGGGAGAGIGGGNSAGLGSILGKLPGVGQFIQPFTDFLPHLAGGGDVLAGHPALIGENGPEIFTPRSAGTVHPNGSLGGTSHTYMIDARGSNDPMAIHAAVARALPHAVAASVRANHQAKMRSPGGR